MFLQFLICLHYGWAPVIAGVNLHSHSIFLTCLVYVFLSNKQVASFPKVRSKIRFTEALASRQDKTTFHFFVDFLQNAASVWLSSHTVYKKH